jgi:hypothetical protein
MKSGKVAVNGQPTMDSKSYPTKALKPALASISDALKYCGNISRAKFYADILPELETVHFGTRHFVVVESMDRLIASKAKASTAVTKPFPASRSLLSSPRLTPALQRRPEHSRKLKRKPETADQSEATA